MRPSTLRTVEEDTALIDDLRTLGPRVTAELQRVLRSGPAYRDALLQQMIGRRELEDLAQLIAVAQTDEAVRLRLLRAIRDSS
jgi:hypothetical protein